MTINDNFEYRGPNTGPLPKIEGQTSFFDTSEGEEPADADGSILEFTIPQPETQQVPIRSRLNIGRTAAEMPLIYVHKGKDVK